MKSAGHVITDVNHYIAGFPEATQRKLDKLRAAIQKAAPAAEETISYRMPAYTLNGPLVYFAAYQHHIGFYPTASGIAQFSSELAGFQSSKGAVQFPLDKPLPLALITRIVKFRVKENVRKAKKKKLPAK